MHQFPLVQRLGISDKVEKESERLDAAAEKLEKESVEVKQKALALEDNIYQKYQAWKRSQIVHSRDVVTYFMAYQNALNEKHAILNQHDREIQRNRTQRESLMESPKQDACDLLLAEEKRINGLYQCIVPTFRLHPRNPDREVSIYRTNIDSLQQTLDFETNASSIIAGRQAIARARTMVRDVLGTAGLRAILTELETKLTGIDFEVKKVTVAKGDFEKLDTANIGETAQITAYLLPKTPPKPTARA